MALLLKNIINYGAQLNILELLLINSVGIKKNLLNQSVDGIRFG